MTTILFVLSFITLMYFVVGAVSLLCDNKLTDYFEFSVEFNGWFCTALASINTLLLIFAISIGALGSIQVLILFAYAVFNLATIAATIYKFSKV